MFITMIVMQDIITILVTRIYKDNINYIHFILHFDRKLKNKGKFGLFLFKI